MKFLALSLLALMFALPVQAAVVRVEKVGERWQLTRDGAPYFVKGACVWGNDEKKVFARMDELKAAGANSARNYWSGDSQSTLDRAQQLGMTVTVGLDVDKPRWGADFSDEKTIAKQEAQIRVQVEKYRDHPALLAWGVGNEVEIGWNSPAQRELVFRTLNRLAKFVKSLDANHPTVVVTAGMDKDIAAQVQAFCPDVDVIGINAYRVLPTLPAQLTQWKFERPYIVTEWGPRGHWESAHTVWNAPFEATSSQKAAQYERAYREGILGDSARCLGSYAFLWGHKQEATATWFGLFLESGERLGAQDVLQKLWTGRAPAVPCPQISTIQLLDDHATAGATMEVSVAVSSARPMAIEWLWARESSDRKTGGDAESAPPFSSAGIRDLGAGHAQITLPKETGPYRIFVFARDDKGGAATANVPIWVE